TKVNLCVTPYLVDGEFNHPLPSETHLKYGLRCVSEVCPVLLGSCATRHREERPALLVPNHHRRLGEARNCGLHQTTCTDRGRVGPYRRRRSRTPARGIRFRDGVGVERANTNIKTQDLTG